MPYTMHRKAQLLTEQAHIMLHSMTSNHRGMTFKLQLLFYIVLAANNMVVDGLRVPLRVPESLLVLQFVATLTTNIEKLSGSPVQVSVDIVTAGSVTVATTVGCS